MKKTQMESFKNAYENKVNLELGWKISVLYSCSTKIENRGLRNVDLDKPKRAEKRGVVGTSICITLTNPDGEFQHFIWERNKSREIVN